MKRGFLKPKKQPVPVLPLERGPKKPSPCTSAVTVITNHDEILKAIRAFEAVMVEPVWIVLSPHQKAAIGNDIKTWTESPFDDVSQAAKKLLGQFLLDEAKGEEE